MKAPLSCCTQRSRKRDCSFTLQPARRKLQELKIYRNINYARESHRGILWVAIGLVGIPNSFPPPLLHLDREVHKSMEFRGFEAW